MPTLDTGHTIHTTLLLKWAIHTYTFLWNFTSFFVFKKQTVTTFILSVMCMLQSILRIGIKNLKSDAKVVKIIAYNNTQYVINYSL